MTNKTSAGLWAVNPDRPLPLGSRWPRLLGVARRFAAANDDYETGRLSAAVRGTIGQTCTPEFAGELLARPPVLPAGVRMSQLLERVQSVAPLEKLPGSAIVLVSVRRSLAGANSSGAIELTLVESAGHWFINDLSVLA